MPRLHQSSLNTQEMLDSKTGEMTEMDTAGSDGTISHHLGISTSDQFVILSLTIHFQPGRSLMQAGEGGISLQFQWFFSLKAKCLTQKNLLESRIQNWKCMISTLQKYAQRKRQTRTKIKAANYWVVGYEVIRNFMFNFSAKLYLKKKAY